MSDTTYEICCFVAGDTIPFSIIASSTTFIGVLKRMIKKEKSDLLQKTDAAHLTLMKVNIDLDVVEDKMKHGKYRPDDANDRPETLESPISLISEVWSELPPLGCLHVFVDHSPTIPYRLHPDRPLSPTPSTLSNPERECKRLSIAEIYYLIMSRNQAINASLECDTATPIATNRPRRSPRRVKRRENVS